jgi:hypothetical protein
MADHVTQDQLDAQTDRLISAMTRGFERVDGHFERLNGRVRTSETEIAVLKDRADRSTKVAGYVSGLIAAVISAFGAWAGSR